MLWQVAKAAAASGSESQLVPSRCRRPGLHHVQHCRGAGHSTCSRELPGVLTVLLPVWGGVLKEAGPAQACLIVPGEDVCISWGVKFFYPSRVQFCLVQTPSWTTRCGAGSGGQEAFALNGQLLCITHSLQFLAPVHRPLCRIMLPMFSCGEKVNYPNTTWLNQSINTYRANTMG